MDRFWMVFNLCGSTPPRVQHPSPDLARREAERLAALNPGQTFHVMEAIGGARKVDVVWAEYHDPAVPF